MANELVQIQNMIYDARYLSFADGILAVCFKNISASTLHIENTDHKFSGYDKTIKQIICALNNLIAEPPKTKRIGFTAE